MPTMQQLTVGFRNHPNHVDHASLNADAAPGVASSTDNGFRIGTVEWANFMTRSTALNVRYLHMNEINEDVPVAGLGYLPTFDPNNLVGGPIHGSRSGEPRDWRRGVRQHADTAVMNSAGR